MRLILRAVPFWNEKSSNLRIAYKDVELNSFINIEADEPMHLVEAFRNARNSGSDVYRRVEIKVRERDCSYVHISLIVEEAGR